MRLVGANVDSIALRQARAEIRRGLHQGTTTLAEVIEDVPPCLEGVMLFQLAMWRYGWGPTALRRLGVRAINAHVNLAIVAGEASARSREWLAEQDRQTPYARKGGMRLMSPTPLEER